MSEEVTTALRNAVLQYDAEAAKRFAADTLKANLNPIHVIRVLTEAIGEVGERFHRMEIYLPHVILAAEAMQAAINVIQETIPKEDLRKIKRGRVVIGTVEGDLHDIGKNIVAIMLVAAGFEVFDLGKDVKADEFIRRAKEVDADIIAISCLMTTTMPYQREVIEELDRLGLRERFKVIVGGGPITREWAKNIGADGYGRDAYEGVELAKHLQSSK